eukprot:2532387-Rhodomonas_salina.2
MCSACRCAVAGADAGRGGSAVQARQSGPARCYQLATWCGVLRKRMAPSESVWCYAMRGTERAYGGTERAYGGTERAYGGTERAYG